MLIRINKYQFTCMSETNSIKLSNFIPLSNIDIQFKEDEETGIKHLYLKGVAHGFKSNLKHIKIRQSATRKAVRRFNAEQKAGRIHQIWIDHAYINPFGTSTPSEKVIGHVDTYSSDEKGANFSMDINPDHPSQIHQAILRRDINGISIGADVKRENLYCSIDGNQIMGDDCEHYWGQKLESGKYVDMEVDDYTLDELTVTAKQADPDGLINLSNISDATLTFTLDAYDKEGKLIENGLIVQKDIQGESLKNTEKYDRIDTNMTGQADVDNEIAEDKSEVTLDKFNQLVDAVGKVQASTDASNDALLKYLQAQERKEKDTLTAQKQKVVSRIIAKPNNEFDEEELLKLDLNYLEKLEKAIIPVEDNADKINQDFGSARIVDNDGKPTEKLTLSREDKKAWMRVKMGLAPEAPKHIQAKVRARLNGESYNRDDKFLQYLLDKNKE